MVDFLEIGRVSKKGYTEVRPRFVLKRRSEDLMIRGGDFYAIWLEDRGLWSTDEMDLTYLVDQELSRVSQEIRDKGNVVKTLYMWDDRPMAQILPAAMPRQLPHAGRKIDIFQSGTEKDGLCLKASELSAGRRGYTRVG
mgnify:CR=1 FL=1